MAHNASTVLVFILDFIAIARRCSRVAADTTALYVFFTKLFFSTFHFIFHCANIINCHLYSLQVIALSTAVYLFIYLFYKSKNTRPKCLKQETRATQISATAQGVLTMAPISSSFTS